MARIETLSAEQWQAMRDYREAQRRDALRTDRIDEGEARAAVARLYTTAGLAAPKYTIILQSPMQCLMARGLMRAGHGDQLRDQLGGQLGGQLWGQLRDQLRGQLGGQLGDQLGGHLGVQLAKSDMYQYPYFIGGWDNFWLAFYDFVRQIGVTYNEGTAARFGAYRAYASSCGVAYLYPEVAFVSDRPERISFDHQRRLHADDGPAVRWRDGYGIYAWRGHRVQDELIEQRQERTAKQITAISNAEHRRVAIEIYGHVHGPERFATDLGAKLVGEDTAQGRPRRLYQVGADRYLHVVNGSLEPDGTRRQFLLGAAPAAATPDAAVAASYGRPARKYREAVRT